MPPENLVENLGDRLEDGLGDVEVTSLLVNLLVDHVGDLLHGVLLRSVELKSLSGRAVVVEDLLEGGTDIDRLHRSIFHHALPQTRPNFTYVHRPELFLHVVGSEEVRDASQLQQQVVLETKNGSRSNQSCLGEDASGNLLTTSLLSTLNTCRLGAG